MIGKQGLNITNFYQKFK